MEKFMMHCVKFNLNSACDKRIAASDLLRTNLANRLECSGKLVIGNLGKLILWLVLVQPRLTTSTTPGQLITMIVVGIGNAV